MLTYEDETSIELEKGYQISAKFHKKSNLEESN